MALKIETLITMAADDNVVRLPGGHGEDQLAGPGGRVGVVVGRDPVAGGVEDLEVRVETDSPVGTTTTSIRPGWLAVKAKGW